MVSQIDRQQPVSAAPLFPKHGQAALMETVLEIVDTALGDVEEAEDNASEQPKRTN